MKVTLCNNVRTRRMRCYASLFSRSVISNIMRYGDYRAIDEIYRFYDSRKLSTPSYLAYYKYIYSKIAREYRCEYVYKNELINKHLLANYGTRQTVYFNEYRVGNSIADLVTFNGVSRAFEIKTELDNILRLKSQLETYLRLFQYVYVVIPESRFNEIQTCIPHGVGIILLTDERKLDIYEVKPAELNSKLDFQLLMQCLRTDEYKEIVDKYFGKLPNVSCFRMHDVCRELIQSIPNEELRGMFLEQMEKRDTATPLLKKIPSSLRQVGLSMNFNKRDCEHLMQRLNVEIKI